MKPGEQKTARRTAITCLITGGILWLYSSELADKLGTLLVAVGLTAAIFWAGNAFFSRKQSTKAKKARQQHPAAPETENSFDQALRIMTLQDDGRRHYEKLPEKARKKSIFGGKMIN